MALTGILTVTRKLILEMDLGLTERNPLEKPDERAKEPLPVHVHNNVPVNVHDHCIQNLEFIYLDYTRGARWSFRVAFCVDGLHQITQY